MKTIAMDPDDEISHDEKTVTLKVYIPDLLIQKSFQFQKRECIWDIKQSIIHSLPKELKDSSNYGIFCPPINGKAGKFFDEHRLLYDYPFHANVGYVELRYKKRVYKMMNVEEKHIKQLHTRANLRRMIDHVNNGQIEKITKLCARGMDPNFHCPETGETPLTLSTALKQPAKVIMALINGGALLDFRTKDGQTALHKAVERNNLEALKTFLDLGASPNYKDNKGMTPLYYTLLHASDHQLTETLLHDHAFIGTCDPQGWQEVHQACKHGLVQHLEHLLFYGADMNARNASGNTPLHVCAVNDQESCTRVLLFRGADKHALNFANQNPYQVAVIAGNLNLGDLIRNHNPEDVVPYREQPTYNPRRRASIAPVATLCRTHSDPRLDSNVGMKPPSPCPSNYSLPPFSSVSCISVGSTGSSSTFTQPCADGSLMDSEDTASGSIVTDKSSTSDSSGVCTSNSGTSYESCADHAHIYDSFLPGNKCICITDYSSSVPGHLQLSAGDTMEVIREAEEGLIVVKTDNGQVGYFPTSCVHEVHPESQQYPRVEGRRERNVKRISTIPRRWKAFGEIRTVILHKGKKGFGFVLRGAKASSPLMERASTVPLPSQYLEDVNKGGVADLAGLKKGDFLLEINGQDVSQTSHEYVVSIIQQSGNLVAMTVITLNNPPAGTPIENVPLPYRQCATLPRKFLGKKAPIPPKRDPKTTLSVGRARARSMVGGLAEIESLDRTLNEYDSEGRSTKSSSVESIPNKAAIIASNAHIPKTASIKARPSSQRVSAIELEQFFARQGSKRGLRSATLSGKPCSGSRHPKVYGSVAEMKRSKASRSKLTEALVKSHKEFSSTPDLKADAVHSFLNNQTSQKRSISQEELNNIEGNRHSWAHPSNNYGSYQVLSDNEEYSLNYSDAWKSFEDMYDTNIPIEQRAIQSDVYAQTLPLPKKEKNARPPSCPPPSHPPPPPPVGQVVKVDISKALGDYANVHIMDEEKNSNVMSSFRPGDSAKLYSSPGAVISVAYKSESVPVSKDSVRPRRVGGGSSLRSQSLPPKISVNKSDKGSTTSSDAENSGDSGNLCSTFKKTGHQRDSMSTDSGHVSDRGVLWNLKGKSAATSAYSSKFDFEDSYAGSPQNFPTVKTPNHEPFIPEPDYESSEDDFVSASVNQGGNLSTFGKGDTAMQDEVISSQSESTELKSQDDVPMPQTPYTEAKFAIQQARERLRFSQKPLDKNATVVFISGKITEPKVEKSEIQLHRTEEGRLTGTVVISTTNEPEESLYLSSSILKTYEKDKCGSSRYPSRDAPASEYAKYRQQILSGLNQPLTSTSGLIQVSELDNKPQNDVITENIFISQSSEEPISRKEHVPYSTEEIKITLTGAERSPINSKSKPVEKQYIEQQFLHAKHAFSEDVTGNSSNGDNETHSDQVTIISCSPEENSQHETAANVFDSGQSLECQTDNQSNQGTFPTVLVEVKTDISPDSLQKKFCEKSIKQIAATLATDSQVFKSDNLSNKEDNCLAKAINNENSLNVIKNAQSKTKKTNISLTKPKDAQESVKLSSNAESSLEESLEVLRLQMNSLGIGSANEPTFFAELVPPPPEFAAASDNKKESYSSSEIAIAPPPEFSDNSHRLKNKVSHRMPSNAHQRKNVPLSCHLNTHDLNFLTSLQAKSSNFKQMLQKDKKSCLVSYGGAVNVHVPCTSSLRHLPSFIPSEHALIQDSSNEFARLKSVQKEFRYKLLQEWTSNDIADWLDSLFMSEYKKRFAEAGITGAKLANMDSNDLMGLGVKQVGHRMIIETSLKRFLQ